MFDQACLEQQQRGKNICVQQQLLKPVLAKKTSYSSGMTFFSPSHTLYLYCTYDTLHMQVNTRLNTRSSLVKRWHYIKISAESLE